MSNVKTSNVYESFDKKSIEGLWIRCWNEPTGVINVRESHHTLSGQRWDQMTKRCKVGSVQQQRAKSYEGCVNLFRDFQSFTDWSIEEVGYNLKDSSTNRFWSLDKDILSDSKAYSENTCIFVPHKINLFVAYRNNKNKELPIGCYYSNTRQKYVAQIKEGDKTINLGGFNTSLEAHRAWQKAKVEKGYRIVEEFNFHEKLYEGLSSRLSHMREQYLNYEVTV